MYKMRFETESKLTAGQHLFSVFFCKGTVHYLHSFNAQKYVGGIYSIDSEGTVRGG